MQSGTALNKWALADKAALVDRAFRLGKELGCDTKNSNRLLEYLRNIPVKDLLSVRNILAEDVSTELRFY